MEDFALLLLWSKGAETDCRLGLSLLQGFCKSHPEICGSPLEIAVLKYGSDGKIFNQILREGTTYNYWRPEEPRWNQSIYLLPVLVKITVQLWLSRAVREKKILQPAIDSTVLRLDMVSRESGPTVQKALVFIKGVLAVNFVW